MEFKIKFIVGFCIYLFINNVYAVQENAGLDVVKKEFRIGYMAGNSDTDISAIDSASSKSIYLDMDIIKYVSFRAAYNEVDDFSTNTASVINLDYSEVLNLGINFSYVNSGPVTPYIGLRLIGWELDVSGVGENLGEADGTEIGGAVGVRVDVGRLIGLNLEFTQVNDVEGTDVKHLQLGAYVRF